MRRSAGNCSGFMGSFPSASAFHRASRLPKTNCGSGTRTLRRPPDRKAVGERNVRPTSASGRAASTKASKVVQSTRELLPGTVSNAWAATGQPAMSRTCSGDRRRTASARAQKVASSRQVMRIQQWVPSCKGMSPLRRAKPSCKGDTVIGFTAASPCKASARAGELLASRRRTRA